MRPKVSVILRMTAPRGLSWRLRLASGLARAETCSSRILPFVKDAKVHEERVGQAKMRKIKHGKIARDGWTKLPTQDWRGR